MGTVLADDPSLTCRIRGGKNPVRIICDSMLRTPLDSRLIETAGEVPTILATACKDPSRCGVYQDKGCRVLTVPGADGRVDLQELVRTLGRMEIDSILLEGGGTLNWSALRSGIVQKVFCYMAPKLFGGAKAKTPVEGSGCADPDEAVKIKEIKIRQIGEDYLMEGMVDRDVYRDH